MSWIATLSGMTQTDTAGTSTTRTPSRVHRAWWIAATTALIILVTGWSTGMPDMLTAPLHARFGWSHGTMGVAFALNIVLYGATAPFAAALMDRFGIRRVVVAALCTVVAGALLTASMTSPWELVLGWGLFVGLGTGSLALTFAATVTSRWFSARRGLVTGVLTSASMFGGMVLMPLLAWLMMSFGWRAGVLVVGLAALVLTPIAWLVLRDHPGELGMRAYGATAFTPPPPRRSGALRRAWTLLAEVATLPSFWALAGTFAICGASTNGVIMTHFVPAANDHGMHSTVSASVLAIVGVCNTVGAAASGWITDRIDPRWLLGSYYLIRGASLLLLPILFAPTVQPGMLAFAVIYGVLDLATVPPTVGFCREFYGNDNGAVVFGWVSAAHAIGAGSAAFLGGVAREAMDTYDAVWFGSGALCVLAAVVALSIRRHHAGPVAAG